MKGWRPILTILACVLLLSCHTSRKVAYDIPADYPEEMQREAISLFKKGKVLYKENCSGCHGIFTKGKKSVPDFSKAQLDNYSARFLRGDPVSHAVARKMSAEQLDQVVVFLRFKKMKKPATVKVGDHHD